MDVISCSTYKKHFHLINIGDASCRQPSPGVGSPENISPPSRCSSFPKQLTQLTALTCCMSPTMSFRTAKERTPSFTERRLQSCFQTPFCWSGKNFHNMQFPIDFPSSLDVLLCNPKSKRGILLFYFMILSSFLQP